LGLLYVSIADALTTDWYEPQDREAGRPGVWRQVLGRAVWTPFESTVVSGKFIQVVKGVSPGDIILEPRGRYTRADIGLTPRDSHDRVIIRPEPDVIPEGKTGHHVGDGLVVAGRQRAAGDQGQPVIGVMRIVEAGDGHSAAQNPG
jgi:hypothetical protein